MFKHVNQQCLQPILSIIHSLLFLLLPESAILAVHFVRSKNSDGNAIESKFQKAKCPDAILFHSYKTDKIDLLVEKCGKEQTCNSDFLWSLKQMRQ